MKRLQHKNKRKDPNFKIFSKVRKFKGQIKCAIRILKLRIFKVLKN